jgi:hypothetical protein
VLPAIVSASYSSRSFRQIGHALVTLLAAMLGGLFARWRYDENSRETESPVTGAKHQPDPRTDAAAPTA